MRSTAATRHLFPSATRHCVRLAGQQRCRERAMQQPLRLVLCFVAGCALTGLLLWTTAESPYQMERIHAVPATQPTPAKDDDINNQQWSHVDSSSHNNNKSHSDSGSREDIVGAGLSFEDYFIPQLDSMRLVVGAGTGPGNNIRRAFYDRRVSAVAVLFAQNYCAGYNCLLYYGEGEPGNTAPAGGLIIGSFAHFNMFDRRLLYCNLTAQQQQQQRGRQPARYVRVLPHNHTDLSRVNAYPLLPVERLEWPADRREPLAICLSTLFGERITNWLSLVQFIEFYRLQGASRIFVYYHSSGNDVKRILNYYSSRNITEVVLWPGPPACTDFYYCQNAMVNDCLYRVTYRYKYAAFIDFDELIVTASGKPIPAVLDRIDTPAYCSFNMKPRWFVREEWDPVYESFNAESLNKLESHITFTSVLNGSQPVFDNHMPKTIIKPEFITAMFIHHYDYKVGTCQRALEVPQNLIHFRHYRMRPGWGSFNQTLAMGPYFEQKPDERLARKLLTNMRRSLKEILRL